VLSVASIDALSLAAEVVGSGALRSIEELTLSQAGVLVK
jgi:hypothetical protein